ncbi:hypothetical protein, partial [Acidocella sp.]|uniref:hypothetical protein n=1 Tax=Acidocella sp. TaxID=50710 RepID=UPI00261ADD8F
MIRPSSARKTKHILNPGEHIVTRRVQQRRLKHPPLLFQASRSFVLSLLAGLAHKTALTFDFPKPIPFIAARKQL